MYITKDMEYLKPHQKQGVEWMVSMEQKDETLFHGEKKAIGGILADEVGLGKTIQTICTILSNPRKTIIIVPKSLVHQWMDEFKKFAPELNVIYAKKLNECDFSGDTYIVSSSLFNMSANSMNTPVHRIQWGRIIIDEAHSIKNKKSKLHKSLDSIKSDIRWCLTATPVMNNMSDFISLLGFVGVSQYVCQGFKDDTVKTYIKRRTKDDVKHLDETLKLPNLTIEVCRVPFSCHEEKQLYNEVYNDTKMRMRKAKNANAIELLEMLLRVRQVCAYPQCYVDGVAKKQKKSMPIWEHESTKVSKITEDILKVREQKSILFCQFIKEMNAYEKNLRDFGIKTVRIDGSYSLDERTENIKKFKDTDANVIIIQIHTGGQGYNLQNAQNVFISCPTWNPCIEYQAIGRAHRTGQKNEVFVKKYILSDDNDAETVFIEENILSIHDKKRQMMASALNDPRIAKDPSIYVKTNPLTYNQLKKLFTK